MEEDNLWRFVIPRPNADTATKRCHDINDNIDNIARFSQNACTCNFKRVYPNSCALTIRIQACALSTLEPYVWHDGQVDDYSGRQFLSQKFQEEGNAAGSGLHSLVVAAERRLEVVGTHIHHKHPRMALPGKAAMNHPPHHVCYLVVCAKV